MTDVLALLVTAISVFNIATMMVNLKLYTEMMKEKSQRERRASSSAEEPKV